MCLVSCLFDVCVSVCVTLFVVCLHALLSFVVVTLFFVLFLFTQREAITQQQTLQTIVAVVAAMVSGPSLPVPSITNRQYILMVNEWP